LPARAIVRRAALFFSRIVTALPQAARVPDAGVSLRFIAVRPDPGTAAFRCGGSVRRGDTGFKFRHARQGVSEAVHRCVESMNRSLTDRSQFRTENWAPLFLELLH
jgi:hypothetical protein